MLSRFFYAPMTLLWVLFVFLFKKGERMNTTSKKQEVILHIREINNLIRHAKTPENKLLRLKNIETEILTGEHTSCKQVQLAVLQYIKILKDRELHKISICLYGFYYTKHRVTSNMYEEPLGKKPKQWQALG